MVPPLSIRKVGRRFCLKAEFPLKKLLSGCAGYLFPRWDAKPDSNIMESTSSGLRDMVRRHRPKREDLDPRKWMKREHVKSFADFILSQHSDRDTDNSFDNKEMCKGSTNDIRQAFFSV